MKTQIFSGAGVAIVTPMSPDGAVDFELLGKLIEFQIGGGTDAIIVCGTTGESSTLTHEEHLKTIRYTVEKTAKRIPVIAGTGSNDTRYAAELSLEAEKAGVDGLLLVTPYYNKTTQKGLIAHYTYIADRVHLPMILYNVPSRTGVNIKPETYKVLSGHPNIVAAKEASGNIAEIARTIALCGDALTVYSGDDNQVLPILALGGKGVISVLSNIMPKETHALCRKFFDGDIEGSRCLQLGLIGLIRALFTEVNPIPVKAALNLMGYPVGGCRLPLAPMDPANLEILKSEMKKQKLL